LILIYFLSLLGLQLQQGPFQINHLRSEATSACAASNCSLNFWASEVQKRGQSLETKNLLGVRTFRVSKPYCDNFFLQFLIGKFSRAGVHPGPFTQELVIYKKFKDKNTNLSLPTLTSNFNAGEM